MRPGAVIGGRFEIGAPVGAGGMGTVYRAQDRQSGRPVAVKVLHDSLQSHPARFRREIELLATLHHPSVVRYVAHGATDEGALYLVTEWLEGEDLSARLARRGALELGASLALATRVAEALGAAHARGVVHRDVKPANLVLVDGAAERVKLLDFGVARLRSSDLVTHAGSRIGTPGYMAPEQARGELDIDARADVFALGCVLFECLTGRPAFVAEHPVALLAKILLEDAPRLSSVATGVPPDLDALLDRMMAKDRSRRPVDGAAVAAELAGIGAGTATDGPLEARALGSTEQRMLGVILVGARRAVDARAADESWSAQRTDVDVSAATGISEHSSEAHLADLPERVEQLADGSVVVAVWADRSAHDLAARAADRALGLHARLNEPPVAVAMGRGRIAGSWPMGEAIDRAAALLAQTKGEQKGGGVVRIDEATAALLGSRFDVRRDSLGGVLYGRRLEPADAARQLLGKATPFVGRGGELRILLGLVDAVVQERSPSAAIVRGAPGVGKTRLRIELERAVRQRVPNAEVWRAQADPARSRTPLSLVGATLRAAAGIRAGHAGDAARQRLIARIARRVPSFDVERVADFLGEAAGLPPPEPGAALRAARADAQIMKEQIERAYDDLMRAECAEQPVVMLLDDLHWADLPSIRLLDAMLRTEEERPLLVAAFGRPELTERFVDLWAERSVTELRLGELSRKASEQLVREALGDGVAEATLARIVTHGEGNAFCLEELVRAEVEGERGRAPNSVLAMTQVRLDALAQDARRVLRAASVFGETFWLGGVTALVGMGIDEVRFSLVDLAEREWIVTRSRARWIGEEEYVFRHALVREAAYGMSTDEDRAAGHRLALDWLESKGEPDAATLADHAERAGLVERAAAHHVRAATRALAAGDLDGAIGASDRAIAAGATGQTCAEAHMVRANAHRWTGQRAPREASLRAALSLVDVGSEPWFTAMGELSSVLGGGGRLDELRELATSMLEWSFAGPTRDAQVIAAMDAAQQARWNGEYRLGEQLRARLPPLEELLPLTAARVHLADASAALVRGDVAAYADLGGAATEAYERAGDERNACSQRGSTGYAELLVGRPERAEPILREVVVTAEALGLVNVVAAARHNLGAALAWQGKLDEALEVERLAVQTFSTRGQRRLACASRIYVAAFLLQADRPAEALEEAESGAAAAPSRPFAIYAHAVAARALVALGRASDALARSTAAFEELVALGGIEEGDVVVRIAHAEALMATGDAERARAVVTEARELLVRRAESIRDDVRRESFLSRVPANARVRELAESLGLPRS